jgi:hypothetical protein
MTLVYAPDFLAGGRRTMNLAQEGRSMIDSAGSHSHKQGPYSRRRFVPESEQQRKDYWRKAS